jgi:hypothetical protein
LFDDFEAPEKKEAQPGGKKLLPQLLAQSALSSALVVKNRKKIGFCLGQDSAVIGV